MLFVFRGRSADGVRFRGTAQQTGASLWTVDIIGRPQQARSDHWRSFCYGLPFRLVASHSRRNSPYGNGAMKSLRSPCQPTVLMRGYFRALELSGGLEILQRLLQEVLDRLGNVGCRLGGERLEVLGLLDTHFDALAQEGRLQFENF
jgi:transposase InsO family protein